MGEGLMMPADVVGRVIDAFQSGDCGTAEIYLSSDLEVRGFVRETLDKRQFLELMDSMLSAIPNWALYPSEIHEKNETIRIKFNVTGKNT